MGTTSSTNLNSEDSRLMPGTKIFTLMCEVLPQGVAAQLDPLPSLQDKLYTPLCYLSVRETARMP